MNLSKELSILTGCFVTRRLIVEKIWLNNYQKGVPAEINPDYVQSISHLFENSCEKFADKPAYSNFGTTLTYGQLHQHATDFAAYLQGELQLQKGDKFAIMLPNLLQYVIAVFGALKAGLTVVNINPLYTPKELLHQINDAKVTAMLVMDNFAHVVEEVLPSSSLQTVVLTRLGDLHSAPKGLVMNLINKYIKNNVPSYKLNTTSFTTALAKGKQHTFANVSLSGSDLAFLQYTGGTTGVAKGTMLTHRNLLANLCQGLNWVSPVLQEGKEIIITPLPLYHILSLTANCLMFMQMGAHNILITNPKDIDGFISELSKVKFSVITGVNTLFNALINSSKFSSLDFSNLKLALGGGMAVQKTVAQKWQKLTGNILIEAYGLTEASPAITINPLDSQEYSGSIGLPLPSTDVSIRNDSGEELPQGETGELWARGPQVMQGYWQNDQATKEVLVDGWLKTGDVAYIDEQGYVYIVDRIKDMILVSGFNVYPNEVEEVIASHETVNEVGVIGIINDMGNESVAAYISVKNTVTAAEIKQHCQKYLTKYKIPKKIFFLDDLPKTNVGKISRKDLKALAESSLHK